MAGARRDGDKKGWRRLEGLGLDERKGEEAVFLRSPSVQAGMGTGWMEAQFLIKPNPIVFLLPISAPQRPQVILSLHPAEAGMAARTCQA